MLPIATVCAPESLKTENKCCYIRKLDDPKSQIQQKAINYFIRVCVILHWLEVDGKSGRTAIIWKLSQKCGEECHHEKLSRIVINWVGFLTVCAKEFLSLWALIHYYTYQYLGKKKKKKTFNIVHFFRK